MTVLIDTDVLLDVALDRHPYSEAAGALLSAVEQRRMRGFVAWHALSNFHYLVAPRGGKSSAREFVAELAVFVEVAPTTTESLRYALRLPMKDFEDAMQVAAAAACHADLIATRNLKDYLNSPVKAVAPETVLASEF